MCREFDGVLQAGTSAPAPAKQLVANVIDGKWVYTWNVIEHGWVVKDKLTLVARGFKQCKGVNVSETFTATVSSFCLHLLRATACECDLDICNFYVGQPLFSLISKKMFFCDCRKGVEIFEER